MARPAKEPKLDANGNPIPKRVAEPRPAYVTFKGANEEGTKQAKEFAEAVNKGDIVIEQTTRKADEILSRAMTGEIDAYVRIMVK